MCLRRATEAQRREDEIRPNHRGGALDQQVPTVGKTSKLGLKCSFQHARAEIKPAANSAALRLEPGHTAIKIQVQEFLTRFKGLGARALHLPAQAHTQTAAPTAEQDPLARTARPRRLSEARVLNLVRLSPL